MAVTTRRERREKARREAMREALYEPGLNALHAGSEYLKDFIRKPSSFLTTKTGLVTTTTVDYIGNPFVSYSPRPSK